MSHQEEKLPGEITGEEKDGIEIVDEPSSLALPETSKDSKTKKLIIGVILVICIGVSQASTIQFAKKTWRPDFEAPFFITWFSAICLFICYPAYLVFYKIFNFRKNESIGAIFKKSQTVFGPEGLTWKKYFTYGGTFSVIALGTNYIFMRALYIQNFHASDVTALFATNSVFVFLLSCVLLKAQIISLKIISVAFAVSGIVLIAGAEEGFKGVGWKSILPVSGALGAALYTVLFKKVIGNARPDQVCFFLTVVASFRALFFWPVIVILHVTKLEVVVSENIPWEYLGGTSSLSVVFNFFINFGVAYTYPLFIAFGGVMTVPLNHVVDWKFNNKPFDVMKIVGTIFIIAAFVLIIALPAKVDKQFHSWVTSTCCRRKSPSQVDEVIEESSQLEPLEKGQARIVVTES